MEIDFEKLNIEISELYGNRLSCSLKAMTKRRLFKDKENRKIATKMEIEKVGYTD